MDGEHVAEPVGEEAVADPVVEETVAEVKIVLSCQLLGSILVQ